VIKVTFEGETHEDVVKEVRAWLETVEPASDDPLSPSQAIEQGADLTKDALRIIAAAAPAPVAQNDVFKALTDMGYKATETTRDRLIEGVGLLDTVTDGELVKQARDTGRTAVYQMNATVARQILKALRP
jgi:hypothetical protein